MKNAVCANKTLSPVYGMIAFLGQIFDRKKAMLLAAASTPPTLQIGHVDVDADCAGRRMCMVAPM